MSVLEKSGVEKINLEIDEGKRAPSLFLILLAGLGFFAYFTGTKLVSSVGNNIGPFEVIAMGIFVVAFLYFVNNRLKVQTHFAVKMLVFIVITAVLSLPNLADRIQWGGLQFLLLVYTAILVLVLFNVLLQFPSLQRHLLRFVVLGAFVTGVWILLEGISTNAAVGTAGPFRNRSHVGIYMATSFWLVLLFVFWPGVTKFERIAAIAVIFVVLYGVAVSGRRSVYLSLFIGLGLLAMSFIFVRGSGRFQMPIAVTVAGGILFFLAQIGSQYVPQLDFFNERIGLIDDRLELAAGTGDEIEDSDNFIVLQREGMFRAINDHPLLGIGWGGFFESEYSPTGHEMHSTPQRFLAELGVVGFGFYLLFNLYLWFASARLFFRVRHTKYQMPALIFAVAIWSLSISWAYNRSVTERTYWILIILFISFERLINSEFVKRRKPVFKSNLRKYRHYPQPRRGRTRSVLPFSGD